MTLTLSKLDPWVQSYSFDESYALSRTSLDGKTNQSKISQRGKTIAQVSRRLYGAEFPYFEYFLRVLNRDGKDWFFDDYLDGSEGKIKTKIRILNGSYTVNSDGFNHIVTCTIEIDRTIIEKDVFLWSPTNFDTEFSSLSTDRKTITFTAPGAAGSSVVGEFDLRAYTDKLHLEFSVFDIEASTDMDGNDDGVGLILNPSMSDYQSEPFNDEALGGDTAVRWRRIGFSNADFRIYLPGLSNIGANSPQADYGSPHVYHWSIDFVNHKLWPGIDGTFYGGGDPGTGVDPWFAADGSGVGSATTFSSTLFDGISMYACVHNSISSGGGGYKTRLSGKGEMLYAPDGYNDPI